METAGEVPMIGLTTYELEKRRKKMAPFWLIEDPGEAHFSRILDFASSITFGDAFSA
jgi:hypothetical protein